MATLRLNDRTVHALKPRRPVYEFREPDLKGFGIKVLASAAKHHFIHNQRQGRQVPYKQSRSRGGEIRPNGRILQVAQ